MAEIINIDRSIIPACDVNKEKFEDIVRETRDITQIGAYKLSAALGLSVGLPTLVNIARRHTNKPLIYDHQKAGTDIPDTGKDFATMLRDCGIDAMIIFPLAGPATQTAWIQSAQEVNLPVISGGHMTHERFLASEGGYIEDAAIEKMYTNSASLGVTDYVVPGNKPEVIKRIREILIASKVDPVFYAPGFITQGGSISEAALVAGPKWHAIVGRAIYEARDIQKVAMSLVGHL
ncbi:MAG: orotidine 5'-phosphate decarboxylase [Ignavibacteriae bacterium]|nr:orotidine 5'-phosphate decarboxylase [Ignavibacteriota bacterium]